MSLPNRPWVEPLPANSRSNLMKSTEKAEVNPRHSEQRTERSGRKTICLFIIA